MPELPEVQTICNLLRQGGPQNPPLVGMTILSAQVLWARSIARPDERVFQEQIASRVIRDIGRRGKYLIFYLSQGAMLIHLRMSGDLIVETPQQPLAPHHRVVFFLAETGQQAVFRLAFNDARKFGRIWLVDDVQEVLNGLGPEPLDANFSAQDLYQKLQNSRRQLKPLLLDQSFLAGLGNIYTDEALHLARLHPLRGAHTLSFEQSQCLWESIRAVLQEGIRRNGASIDWVYRGGDFQNYFRVYQRTGQPCTVCGAPVERIVVGQRGTHFCPSCQPVLHGLDPIV